MSKWKNKGESFISFKARKPINMNIFFFKMFWSGPNNAIQQTMQCGYKYFFQEI